MCFIVYKNSYIWFMKALTIKKIQKANRINDYIKSIEKVPRIYRSEKQVKTLKSLKKTLKGLIDPKTIEKNRKIASRASKKAADKRRKRYNEYLQSEEWAQLKIDLFNHRGKKCEKCSSEEEIHVHHLHYRNIFNEEPEDLVILCKKCHFAEHKDKRRKKKKKAA